MFQFTREFIINNNEGLLGEKKEKFIKSGDFILIDNLINIDTKSIHKVYKTGWQEAKNEKIICKRVCARTRHTA